MATYGKRQLTVSDLPTNNVTAGNPEDYVYRQYPIVSESSEEPVGRTLSINCTEVANTIHVYPMAPSGANWMAGNMWAASLSHKPYTPVYAGVFLEYELRGVKKACVFDWRCGDYQLPVANIVKAALLIWRPYTVATGAISFLFEASLAPVVARWPKRPVLSAKVQIGAASNLYWYMQSQTRWLDFDYAGPTAAGNANAPILDLYASAGDGPDDPVRQKDATGKTWYPAGGPYEMSNTRQFCQLFNNGAAAANVVLREFLEW